MKPILLPMPGAEPLCAELATRTGFPTGWVELKPLPDGETHIRVGADHGLRDREIILVTCLHPEVNDRALSLYFAASTARDLGARHVGLVAPYLPYLRQERRTEPHEGVTAAYFAQFLGSAIDWLATVEPHLRSDPGLSSFYSIPTHVLWAAETIAEWIGVHVEKPLLVGPDEGSRESVTRIAGLGGFPSVVLAKKRTSDREVSVRGDEALLPHRGRKAIIVDDILSTGGTMAETVKRLISRGFIAPWCLAVHGLFAPGAEAKLAAAGVGRVVTANTVPHATNAIDMVPQLARLIAELGGH